MTKNWAVEWLKVKALSSSPSTENKTKWKKPPDHPPASSFLRFLTRWSLESPRLKEIKNECRMRFFCGLSPRGLQQGNWGHEEYEI
jgi:hypothetical protein